MSFYIILRGSAGAGKTTIAKRLVQIYNGSVKEIMGYLPEIGL